MEKGNCINCICKSHLFNYLTESEIIEINNLKTTVSFKNGEIIAKQGTPANYFISLRNGFAKLNYEGVDKKSTFIGILQPTDISIGPGFFVDDKYHFTYTALSDIEACFIKSDFIKKIIFNNNVFCEAFIKDVNIKHIRYIERNHSNNHKNMTGRVAEALLILSKNIFKASSFDLLISRQDLADFTHMTKESLIRALKEIKDDGIIYLEKNFVNILDYSKLENLSKKA